MKRQYLIVIFVSICLAAGAQQQASYTQYMFNGMVINPGYIGSHDALSFSLVGRWQWLGMEGAPNTQTLSVHSPIRSKNMGVGLQVSRDEIAVTTSSTVMGGYAYKISVGGGFLSMGLQGGVQMYNANYSEAYTLSTDPTFQDSYSATRPNFGTGLFYYNSVFYAGFSIPELLNNKVESKGQSVLTQRRHYFWSGGAVFALSPSVKMKPNFLIKAVDGAPLSVDYNLNFLLQEILWLGVSYRAPESVSFLVEFNVNRRFRLGYAMDYILDATISQATQTSHELMLNYKINLVKDQVVTPRYF